MINKILKCADCLEVLAHIPDNYVDLIITDPPYDISATNGGGTVNKIKKLDKSLKDLVDAKINEGYDIEKFNKEFVRVMKDINIYIWCNKVQIPAYFDFYVKGLGCKFDIITWSKPNALPTYSNKYLSDTEYLLYFRKGGSHCHPENYEDAKTYYIAPINHKDKKIWKHPTIKPLDITEKVVRNSSKPGEIILDPFMGSGTTGVAALTQGRKFIGIELNEEYFKIAEQRIAEAEVSKTEVISYNNTGGE